MSVVCSIRRCDWVLLPAAPLSCRRASVARGLLQILRDGVGRARWVDSATDLIMKSITAFKNWRKTIEAAGGVDSSKHSKDGCVCM